MRVTASKLDRTITFQRKAETRDARLGTINAGDWTDFATVRAEVQEQLPSRAESLDESINLTLMPVRIRMRYRADITAKMRVIYAGRTLEIVSGPVEIGRRDGLELMAQEFSSGGDPA